MGIRKIDLVKKLAELRGNETAKQVLTELLIQSLAPQEITVLKRITNEPISSMKIAEVFDWNQNHATNLLTRLKSFGLIESRVISNEHGLYNVWLLKPVNLEDVSGWGRNDLIRQIEVYEEQLSQVRTLVNDREVE